MKKTILGFLALSLVGCATAPVTDALGGGGGSFKFASKDVIQSLGYGLGWDYQSAERPIVDDLPQTTRTPGIGFNVQDAASTASVDLREQTSPIANQGQIGACTAFALVKGLGEFLELKQLRAVGADTSKFVPLSAAYLYYRERAFTHQLNVDAGGQLFLATNLMYQGGAVPEQNFPDPMPAQTKDPAFVKYYLNATPSLDVGAGAVHFDKGSMVPLDKLSDIKASLDAGDPVVFGMMVFYSMFKAQGGMIPLPTVDGDMIVGGHAVMAVGYDDSRSVLIVRNSWGPDWGDHGYFYLPYVYFDKPLGLPLASDAWTLKE